VTGANSFGRDEFSDSAVDVALGQLAGRERQAMLAHLEACIGCRLEVQELTGVVDELVLLTPATEPPTGFEGRVTQRLTREHSRRHRPAGVVAAGAIAAGVTVAGVTALGVRHLPGIRGPTHPAPPSARTVSSRGVARTGTLLVSGEDRGNVVITSGQPDWLFLSVRGTGWTRLVTCEIIVTDAGPVTVGTFMVHSGQGSWGTALPVPVEQLRGVVLTDARGSELGRAPLPA
jgi:hypothetical protein